MIKQENQNFVYVVKCQEFYKIGYTNNIIQRLKTFDTDNPYEIKMIFGIYVDNAPQLENSLHTCFLSKRVKGEWFKLEEIDLKLIAHFLIEHYLNNTTNYLRENPALIKMLKEAKLKNDFSGFMGKTLG